LKVEDVWFLFSNEKTHISKRILFLIISSGQKAPKIKIKISENFEKRDCLVFAQTPLFSINDTILGLIKRLLCFFFKFTVEKKCNKISQLVNFAVDIIKHLVRRPRLDKH